MDVTILSLTSLILCASFFIAGMMDAICGGGGLISMPVFLASGFPVHYISGTSQCANCPGSFMAFAKYAKSGKIQWSSAVFAVPTAILGSLIGARFNVCLSAKILEMVMIILVPIVAIIMLCNKELGREDCSGQFRKGQLFLRSALLGLGVGMYHGFYAAGAGMFYMLAFVLIDKLDLTVSSGNTKLVVVFSNIAATVTYALSGVIIWKFALVAMLFTISGNYLGAKLAVTKGETIIRPMFFVVIFILLVTILGKLIVK
ncbi:MAG: TSUP family transporter [Eubacteriales bacterium]|nr:TSUP family transporter [Eubacteriales bacterium]